MILYNDLFIILSGTVLNVFLERKIQLLCSVVSDKAEKSEIICDLVDSAAKKITKLVTVVLIETLAINCLCYDLIFFDS